MNVRGYLRECAHAENVRGFCGGTRVIDRVRYRLFQSGQHVSMAHGRKNVCKLDMEFFFVTTHTLTCACWRAFVCELLSVLVCLTDFPDDIQLG